MLPSRTFGQINNITKLIIIINRHLGDLGATYDDHLRLIEKCVGDFLLVLIELISLGRTAEALQAIIGSKSATSLHRGPVDPKILKTKMAISSNYVVHVAMFCEHFSNKIRKNEQTNTAQEDVKMHVFKISVGQKVVGLPIGSKKWVGNCPPCPIGSAVNARQTVPKAQKKLAEKQ